LISDCLDVDAVDEFQKQFLKGPFLDEMIKRLLDGRDAIPAPVAGDDFEIILDKTKKHLAYINAFAGRMEQGSIDLRGDNNQLLLEQLFEPIGALLRPPAQCRLKLCFAVVEDMLMTDVMGEVEKQLREIEVTLTTLIKDFKLIKHDEAESILTDYDIVRTQLNREARTLGYESAEALTKEAEENWSTGHKVARFIVWPFANLAVLIIKGVTFGTKGSWFSWTPAEQLQSEEIAGVLKASLKMIKQAYCSAAQYKKNLSRTRSVCANQELPEDV